MGWMRDETGLGKRAANYVPLTPLSHLQRAALVFADREAVVYGKTRYTYAKYYRRVSRLASALAKAGHHITKRASAIRGRFRGPCLWCCPE